ncbi:hypothetical protein [Nonomuraea sp. JJY05]|uniref:hypothetical protein n=1 Tax=Nonomuraea sp. JJY05 TaxID=3350255 RepID=UPI00373F9BC6
MPAVYPDGWAIADAAHEPRLPPAEVETLLEVLNHDLAGQPRHCLAPVGIAENL